MKKLQVLRTKTLKRAIFAAFLLLSATMGASAQMATFNNQTSGSTLPGTTGADYDLFQGGPFSSVQGSDVTRTYSFGYYNSGYNGTNDVSIAAPGGTTPVYTIVDGTNRQFYQSTPVEIASYSINSGSLLGSTFNASVLFGNGDQNVADNAAAAAAVVANNGYPDTGVNSYANGYTDTAIELTLLDSMGNILSTTTQTTAGGAVVSNVVDANTSTTSGLFANFTLTGVAAGDSIQISALATDATNTEQSGRDQPYIGGVSFYDAAPEPSTYALLIGGMAFLGLAVRNTKKFRLNS